MAQTSKCAWCGKEFPATRILLVVLVLLTVVKNARQNATESWGEVNSKLFTPLITFYSRCSDHASEMFVIAFSSPRAICTSLQGE
jgi:hypothetical protein